MTPKLLFIYNKRLKEKSCWKASISFASDLNFPSWLKTSQHDFTVVNRQNTLQQKVLDFF